MLNRLPYYIALLALAFALVAGCETTKQSRPTQAKPNVTTSTTITQHLREGEQYFNQENYDMAIVSYGMALELDPNLAEAHRGLARTYEAIGIDELAKRNHKRALNLDPQSEAALQQVVEVEQIPMTATALNEATPGTEIAEVTMAEEITSLSAVNPRPVEQVDTTPTATTPTPATPADPTRSVEPAPAPVSTTMMTEIDSIPTIKRAEPVTVATPKPQPAKARPAAQPAVEIVAEPIPTREPVEVPPMTTPEPTVIAEVTSVEVETVPTPAAVEPVAAVVPAAEVAPAVTRVGDVEAIRALIARGDTKTALVRSVDLANKQPGDLEMNRIAAQLLIDSGGANEALPFIQRLMDANENDPEAWRLFALASYQGDNFPEAVYGFQQAQRLGTLSQQEELLHARSLLRLNQKDRALILLEQIHGRQATYDSAAMLGSTLLRDRQYDRALKYLKDAHRMRPKDTTIMNKLGACHIAMYRRSADPRSRAAALAIWRQSLKADPNQPDIRKLLEALEPADS